MEYKHVILILSELVTLLLVLPVHECAHALVAKWYGDDTAERQGRLTLNPIAHIDPLGAILMVTTGFGWAKPVPINPLRFKKQRQGIAVVSLAGPVSNILAAFVAAFAYAVLMHSKDGWEAYHRFQYQNETSPMFTTILLLSYLVEVNVGLAIFNMIPIPPLDGSKVLSYFTSSEFDRWAYRHQREIQIGFLVFIGLMYVVPYEYNPLYYIRSAVSDLIWESVSWIPQYKH
ncbi:MAG: site-2 protease family protein [Ruminococcus sp.]|nr:site-2 protease family protein [Ruminococcus sp.]